jgi:SAM-dependent methyltransferase
VNEHDLVRRGYDALSPRYRADDAPDGEYAPWLATLVERLPASATVLDLGCGNGVPVARFLTVAGHRVTGVDISDVQIARARRLVPDATFMRADATTLDPPPASFDGIVCLYALIHMPLADQPGVLDRIAGWLRPGGWLLATTGHTAWTGTEDDWLGGGTTCGGATPTPRRTGCGCRRPGSSSRRKTSSRTGPARTRSSGPGDRRPYEARRRPDR